MIAAIAVVLVLTGLVLISGGFLLGAWWGSLHFAEMADHLDAHPEDYGA